MQRTLPRRAISSPRRRSGGPLPGTVGRHRRISAGGPGPSVMATILLGGASYLSWSGDSSDRASASTRRGAVPGISSIRGRQATAATLRGRSAAPGKSVISPGGPRGCPSGPTSAVVGPRLALASICSTARSTTSGLRSAHSRSGAGSAATALPENRLMARATGSPVWPASSTAERATWLVTDSARVAFVAVTRSLLACVPAPSARLARAICAAVVSDTRPAAVSGTRTACAASRVAHGTRRSCASSTSSTVTASEMTSGPRDAVRTSHSTSAGSGAPPGASSLSTRSSCATDW